MDETELLSTLQSHLDSGLGVPVYTAGHSTDWEVPLVVIEEWDTTEYTFHNSPFAGEKYEHLDDDNVKEYERYYRFYWRTRVEVTCRAGSDKEASKLQESVKSLLRNIRIEPQEFHNHLNECRLRTSGNPQQQFFEPTESEETVSAVFIGLHEVVREDFNAIVDIKNTFTNS